MKIVTILPLESSQSRAVAGRMKRVQLHYGKSLRTLRFPEHALVSVCEPSRAATLPKSAETVQRTLDHPIDSPRLREIARGKSTAAIAISDFSRATPDDLLLPLIFDELNSAGISDRDITVIIGAGLHRHMAEAQVKKKVGKLVYERVRVTRHDPDRNLTHVGTSKFGNEIWINRDFVSAGVRIATGDIIPHPYAGYSAGAKAVMPGLAGRATILRNHLYVKHGLFMGRLHGNPVREEMNEAARMAGLDFIVNTVMDAGGNLVKVVAGDPVSAHAIGAEASAQIYRTEIPRTADLYVLSSYPYDGDFYYASKSLENVGAMVSQDAGVLMLSPCTGGWGNPDLRYFLLMRTPELILTAIERNPRRNLVTAIIAYEIAQLRARCNVALYAKGLPRGDVRKMQMYWAADPQDSVDAALRTRASGARVVVMPKAAVSMPVSSSA